MNTNTDLKSWDDGALDYLTEASEETDVFKRLVDTPSFISLIDNIQGKKILDIGCGNGDFCKQLGERGAEVTGLDGSRNMIEEAKKVYPQADYVISDLMNEELPFDDNSFDIVTSKMMLMNISSVKTVSERAYKVLKHGGLYAIDVVHPFRPLLKSKLQESSNRYDSSFNYFKETASSITFANNKYAFYYRSIGKYMNDVVSAGFIFNRMEEISVDEQFVAQYPKEQSKLNMPIALQLLFHK
jgi:ubiquinone/menaquinone biosynthesis C-methylase UbiE